MDLNKIKDIAKHLTEKRKAHLEREIGGIFYHGERTANLALQLRKEVIPNDDTYDDILTAAAWLHDCAKGIEPHDKYGALIAREAIADVTTEEDCDKICELIALHCSRCPEDNSYNDATKLLQDADLVDHFGIYEIWMNIQYWAHTKGSIEDMIAYYEAHHDEHIQKHRKLLNYSYSKVVFDDRVAFQERYIDRLKCEGKGFIYPQG